MGNDDSLHRLDDLAALRQHALQCVQRGRRKLCILSNTLDPELYDRDEFRDALRDLVISDRYCEARILVKDIRPLVERGHRLLELSRRLSSKVLLRKLTVEPKLKDAGWMVVDTATLLFRHDEALHQGFVDYAAAPRCRQLLEEFTTLWELYGEADPALRQQLL